MPEVKPFYSSVTLWGAALALVSAILGRYGVDVSGVGDLAQPLATIGGVVAAIVVAFGRLRANGTVPITVPQAQAQRKAAAQLRGLP